MIKARFIREIGTRVYLRRFCYSSKVPAGSCAHDAKVKLSDEIHPPHEGVHPHYGGSNELYPAEMWPQKCDHCGADLPADTEFQVFNKRLYNSPSGHPEPGDLYWITWYPENMHWDNHVGPHLCAVLPNGREWVIDSRASNCTMPGDRTHRCWVRHGDPETGQVHVDKNGHTCNAGAGSIASGDYHGFLHNGQFT